MTPSGRGRRRAGAALVTVLVAAVAAAPLLVSHGWSEHIALAAVYSVIGLSVNVLAGHAGHVPLGHQALVGIGAFTSAYVVSQVGAAMPVAVGTAAVAGAGSAVLMGVSTLRLRSRYVALVTLVFGLAVQVTLFRWDAFTGGASGVAAARPDLLADGTGYAYLCLAVLALVLLVDRRLERTRTGRALALVRHDERLAAGLGIDVSGYKLLAYVLSGLFAGLGGALLAHRAQEVQAADFGLQIAIGWALMAALGGLRSRTGVVLASALFSMLPAVRPEWLTERPEPPLTLPEAAQLAVPPLVAGLLLVLTLRFLPGGVAGLLAPRRRWLRGGPSRPRRSHAARAAAGTPEAGFPPDARYPHPSEDTVEVRR